MPAPAVCKVVEMDVRPGGALVAHINEREAGFAPHLDACFLDVLEHERIVFTNALVRGWRPAAHPFMTAIITLTPCAEETKYAAHVMHKDGEQQQLHARLGFDEGWGTVIAQLARVVESAATGTGGPR